MSAGTNLRAELEERLRFETLIAVLSSKFVELPKREHREVDRASALAKSWRSD
jgi:hypothetical protein